MRDELDRELLRRFVQGDQVAFESLFRQFEPEVYRWILRIVRNASSAQDILIEAFWRAYRGRARFDSSRSLDAENCHERGVRSSEGDAASRQLDHGR
jgi:DNA-directed RNA polymerase specialized sigma24 family protein